MFFLSACKCKDNTSVFLDTCKYYIEARKAFITESDPWFPTNDNEIYLEIYHVNFNT